MSSAPYPYPGQQPGPHGPWPVAPSATQQAPAAAPVPHTDLAPPPAYLDLTVQGSAAWTSMVPPAVHVNGWELPQKYGRSTVPVPPGWVRVDVVAQWTKKYGHASLDLQAAPGQVIPVFYAMPYHVFSKGAIGHVRQRRPGLLGFLLPLVVVGAVVAVLIASLATSS